MTPVARDGATTSASDPGHLVSHMRSRPGFSFCAHCLARELHLPVAEVRDAMWTLEPDPAFSIRTAQCVSCLLVKRVVRHEEPADDLGEARKLVQFIVHAKGLAYCQTCLAFAADLALASVRHALLLLEGMPEIKRHEATCEVCGRWQTVVASSSETVSRTEADDAALGDVVRGCVRHRGYRVDLLSFRVAGGWRPLALIKTVFGAVCPDAPAIMLTLTPTKLEADELAASEARAWIDKRVP